MKRFTFDLFVCMFVSLYVIPVSSQLKESDFEAMSPHNWRTGGLILIKFYIVVSCPYLSVK